MKEDFRKANCCSRLFFCYAWPLISSVNKNKGTMEDKMLIDMKDTEDETLLLTKKFEEKVEKALAAWTQKNPTKHREQAPWYPIIRNAIFSCI